MGMAASQARLLTITARLHDVEYKAQSIQNAKIQLSTQSDQVYQEYLQALDATTLTVADINGNQITANFNNLCGKNAVDTGNKYALRDSNKLLIVEDDMKDAYDKFIDEGGTDPYQFALYVLNGDNGNSVDLDTLEDDENTIYEQKMNNGSEADEKMEALKEKMDKILSDNGASDYNDLSDEAKEEYDLLEIAFKNQLYSAYGDQVYALNTGEDVENFNKEDFDYYVNLFKQIQQAGGCVSIADYNGPDGDAANDSDWLQNMIQCGKIYLDIVNTDEDGNVTFSSSSPSSDTYVSYTNTSDIDKTALAKAEAEYEHKTKEIDQKDKKYDMDLSKLETERTALTTEYESVKKVINDNIERTFGIFS